MLDDWRYVTIHGRKLLRVMGGESPPTQEGSETEQEDEEASSDTAPDAQSDLPAEPEGGDGPSWDELVSAYAKLQKMEPDYHRLRREIAETHKKRRQDEGKWKELYEQAEQEKQELRKDQETREKRDRVRGIASRLKFFDPSDAHRFLSDDEMSDDKLTERALKQLRKEKPRLFDEPQRSGAEIAGGTSAATTLPDQDKLIGPDRLTQVERKNE